MIIYHKKTIDICGINVKDLTSENGKEYYISLEKNDENINIYYECITNENKELISFEKNQKMQKNNYNKTIVAKYENSKNRIEVIGKQENKIVNDFEETVKLNKENSIVLNNLEEAQLNAIKNKVTTKVNEKIEKVLGEFINIEDFKKVLENIIVFEEEFLDEDTITQTEVDRFNAQFELIEAEGIQNEDVIKTIDIIKNNLIGIKLESNDSLKLELDRNNYNEKIAETVTQYMQKLQNKKYNISIEYDSETKLAKYVVLKIVE